MCFRYHRKRIDRFASTHPHYSFDAFSTVHTMALSTLMRFQKYAFSLSSKTHRSICVHTTFVMRFLQSRLRPCLHLFVFKSLRFRCHQKRVDRLASTLPFYAFSTLHSKALSTLIRKRIDRFASTLMPGFH